MSPPRESEPRFPPAMCDGTGTIRDFGMDGEEIVLCPGCEHCEPHQPIPAYESEYTTKE